MAETAPPGFELAEWDVWSEDPPNGHDLVILPDLPQAPPGYDSINTGTPLAYLPSSDDPVQVSHLIECKFPQTLRDLGVSYSTICGETLLGEGSDIYGWSRNGGYRSTTTLCPHCWLTFPTPETKR